MQSLERGGSERQAIGLANHIASGRGEVLVVTFYNRGDLGSDLSAEARLVSLRKRSRWEIFRFFRRLRRLIRSERPDVVYSFLVEPNIVSLVARGLSRKPKVVWGVRASDLDLKRYDLFTRLSFKLSIRLARFADLIIVNSKQGRDFHVGRGYPSGKLMLIPNGIETSAFRPIRDGQKLRDAWIGDADFLVGVIGRLHPTKGHELALEAIAGLPASINVRFVCVGHDWDGQLARLQGVAERLGVSDRVLWVGEMKDMPVVYSALDLLLHPSPSEGFPNVVAEAMACGVPCVVTDVGEASTIVGETGKVVPPNDPQALANAVAEMLDVQARLTEESNTTRARIESHFDASSVFEQTAAALRRLVR